MAYSFCDSNWKKFEEQGNISEAINMIILEIANNLMLALKSSFEACDLPSDNYTCNTGKVRLALNSFEAETMSFQYLAQDFQSALRDLEIDSTREKEDVFEDLKEIAEQLQCEIENRERKE